MPVRSVKLRKGVQAPIIVPTVVAVGGDVALVTIDDVDYMLHTFEDGNTDDLVVLQGGDIDYLVVGGGGAGGNAPSSNRGSGGSGGEVKTGSATLGAGTFPVVVGAGGLLMPEGSRAEDGEVSTFNGVTAGAGRGGYPSQGLTNTNTWGYGKGGGGWVSTAGSGGAGIYSTITGTNTRYGGGGGGCGETQAGNGGSGGGGKGSLGATDTAIAGEDGKGGGGGGGKVGFSKPGGAGIVIVRYRLTPPSEVPGDGADEIWDEEDDGLYFRYHKFTSSGDFILNSDTWLEYLIVGGGGGGGGTYNVSAGGGGGGGDKQFNGGNTSGGTGVVIIRYPI